MFLQWVFLGSEVHDLDGYFFVCLFWEGEHSFYTW